MIIIIIRTAQCDIKRRKAEEEEEKMVKPSGAATPGGGWFLKFPTCARYPLQSVFDGRTGACARGPRRSAWFTINKLSSPQYSETGSLFQTHGDLCGCKG